MCLRISLHKVRSYSCKQDELGTGQSNLKVYSRKLDVTQVEVKVVIKVTS